MEKDLKALDYVLKLIGEDIEENGTNDINIQALVVTQTQINNTKRLSNGGNYRGGSK